MKLPKEIKDALLLLDMGQQFALANRDHEGTREDVKKLRAHIEVIKAYCESLEKPFKWCKCGKHRWWSHYPQFIDNARRQASIRTAVREVLSMRQASLVAELRLLH